MLETIIRKITAVKYIGEIIPTERPFCETINATSPLVIIPTPILKLSFMLNLHNLAMIPHPMIFVINATSTKLRENRRIVPSILSILVFKPILAKKTGPKII